MDPKNPFVYNRVLRPKDPACPRPELERSILRTFADRERLALVGDRRLGKSSLVRRTLEAHGNPCVVIDLLGLKDIDGLCAVMAAALEEYVRQRSLMARKVAPWLREIGLDLRDVRVTLAGGPVRLEVSSARSTTTLRHLLDRIAELGQREPLAVFFDEFQEISDQLPTADARHALGLIRSMSQHHSDVSYYFAGSAKDSFTALFTRESAPFFEGAQLVEVTPIPRRDFARFLLQQFEKSARPAESETVDAILDLGWPRAADIQHLAHEAWYAATSSPVDHSAVSRGLLKIISDLESTGLATLRGATALQQRALFTAAFFQGSPEPQTNVAQIARFRATSVYRKSLKPFMTGEAPVLEDLGIGRIRFRHHYLRLWFLMQYSRAVNLLPVLRDPEYYRQLLPAEVRTLLAP